MARTPKPKATTRQSRPARSTAPVRFANEDEENESIFADNQSDGERYQDSGTMSNVLQEHRDRQKKKASTRSITFLAQKKEIYAVARNTSKEIAKASASHIEEARDRIRELKNQERSYDKHFKDFERLCAAQEASIKSLSIIYPSLFEDLATRRSDRVNAASGMVKANPIRRQTALKTFSRNARVRVEEVRGNEKAATDASKLIKHYKNLLCV